MFSGFSTNSFGTGWTKLSIIRDSDDVQLLYNGIVYVGWCDLFDKRLENACHNHERTLSFVFLILVVSNCLSAFYPSSVFRSRDVIIKRLRLFKVAARITEMVIGEKSIS